MTAAPEAQLLTELTLRMAAVRGMMPPEAMQVDPLSDQEIATLPITQCVRATPSVYSPSFECVFFLLKV